MNKKRKRKRKERKKDKIRKQRKRKREIKMTYCISPWIPILIISFTIISFTIIENMRPNFNRIFAIWTLEFFLREESQPILTNRSMCQVWFTLGWKSAGWTRRWADLWNDLGFSLCAVPSVCCVVATSDDGEKSKMGVSTDWCVTVEHWRSSSMRVYFCQLSD